MTAVLDTEPAPVRITYRYLFTVRLETARGATFDTGHGSADHTSALAPCPSRRSGAKS
jgi:hypothetical protein